MRVFVEDFASSIKPLARLLLISLFKTLNFIVSRLLIDL